MREDGLQTPWQWVRDDATRAPAGAADYRTAFRFVQALAAELSSGRIDLPAAPDVASRVHQALEDDDLSSTRIARVGADLIRGAALPYVLEKLRAMRRHEHMRADLEQLWGRSTLVAAIARAIAVRTGCAPPDVALLAGLLHNLGSVYLLARAQHHPELFRSPAVRDVLMHEWQAPIGRAIAENWGLPDAIAAAIGDQDQLERHDAGERDLTDALCIAARAASFIGRRDGLEIALAPLQSFRRLGLDCRSLHEVMRQASLDVEGLRAALGH
jgi:HD-like signal output (HDOD) protein